MIDLKPITENLLHKHKCYYEVMATSNIYKLDELGYPSVLARIRCSKCGREEIIWRPVSEEWITGGTFYKLEWNEIPESEEH